MAGDGDDAEAGCLVRPSAGAPTSDGRRAGGPVDRLAGEGGMCSSRGLRVPLGRDRRDGEADEAVPCGKQSTVASRFLAAYLKELRINNIPIAWEGAPNEY